MNARCLASTLLALTFCLPSRAEHMDHKPEDRLKDPPINDKTKPIVECMKKMIEFYKKIGAEDGPMKKAANETAAALESVLKDGRGYAEAVSEGSAGVDQEDTPAKTKHLVVEKSLKVWADCDPCKPFFHLMMGTLVHEAVHFGQPLTTGTPASVEEKLKKLEQECPGYEKGLAWRQDLRNAIENAQRELRGMGEEGKKAPKWLMDLLKECKEKDPEFDAGSFLFDLLKLLKLDISNDEAKTGALDDYLSKCLRDLKDIEKMCGKDKEKWLDCLDKDGRLKDFYHPVPFDGPETAFSLNARAGEFFIDGEPFASGVPGPQDAIVFEVNSASWILIVGNILDDGPGKAKLHRLERQSGRVRSVEVRDVADSNGFLEFVTGVARRDDGRFFVFDFDTASVHELRDSDADGLPDQVGPAAASLPPPDEARHFCHISANGNDLVLRIRAIEPLLGNSPLLVLSDSEGDGIYESFERTHPSEFRSLPPCWLGTLVEGMPEIGVAGAHGHPFVVRSLQNPNQPLSQGQFPAFPNRIVFVPLARPLQVGEELEILDLVNNQSTPSGTVETRRPVLHLAVPARIRPKEEVEVTLRGAGFESVKEVQIGGKKAEIVSSGPGELRVRTAKLKREERYQVTFQLQDKSEREAEMALFPDLSGE